MTKSKIQSILHSSQPDSTMDSIFETNYNFQLKNRTMEKVQLLFFMRFLLSIDKLFILGSRLGCNSTFWHFPDIS